jgi:transcription elongation factor Elf1
MSDYYQHEPTCPNCGTRQTSLISTTDDPEMDDSYFICENCKHKIRVHASMTFDYIDESLPSCGGNQHCASRDNHNRCRVHFKYDKCASAVIPGEKTKYS